MERVTMERAVSRQQIVAIRDWDAYQASLIGREGRMARAQNSLTTKTSRSGKREKSQ